MMKPITLRAILLFLCFAGFILANGQDNSKPPVSKPYKVMTSGKQITIKAISNLRSIMVWTSNGHRLIEQKIKDENSYTFTVTIKENIFFVMIEMADGKRFTEKIGVR